MNSSYSEFAYMYDELMSDVDYNKWIDYTEEILKRYNINANLVLELACGTGNICNKMAQKGYEMIGIDISTDMLSVAMEKSKEKGLDILYLNQDMTQFELYGTVDIVLCFMDSINYILKEEDLIKTFKLINNYLNEGGLFIFDINTQYKLKEILANNTFIEEQDDIFYVWENEYNLKSEICEFYLTFFIKDGKKYRRIDEVHRERAYSTLDIKKCIEKSGLTFEAVYEQFTFNDPSTKSERNFFIVKKA